MQKYLSNKNLAYFFIGIYLIFSIIWHFSTSAPWDDDCVGRYFNAKDAVDNPAQFISVWNRPLFILFFFIPFLISKHTVLLMAAISAASAYVLFKAVEKEGEKSSYLIVPFLLFQTFFFTISRSALGEPLAAALLAFGYYFYRNKQLLPFAIMGSLIPLARLEMSVVLIFWAYIIVRDKQWKYLIILGIPSVLWNFAGTLIEGDLFWLYENTFGKESDSNRYGHTDFWHYFVRYIYTIGPIIFYFFFIGFLELIYRKSKNVLLIPQFTLAFILYVVFSWKLNLGQAAGFLRHLASISPIAALIALKGYNYWLDSFTLKTAKKQVESQPILKEDNQANENREKIEELELQFKKGNIKRREYRHQLNLLEQGSEQEAKKAGTKAEQKEGRFKISSKTRMFVYLITMLLLTFFHFSAKLTSHHFMSDDKDYTNLITIGILSSLFVIFVIVGNRKKLQVFFSTGLGLIITLAVVSFTLITEPPNSHNSAERKIMSVVSEAYINAELNQYTTYTNHSWVNWIVDKKRDYFVTITQENLNNAPDSSIIIWENHYGSRLKGDVQENFFDDKPEFIELLKIVPKNSKFIAKIFQKINGNISPQDVIKMQDRFIASVPDLPSAYSTRARAKEKLLSDLAGAEEDLSYAVKLDTTDERGYHARGTFYYKTKKFQRAKQDFIKYKELGPKGSAGFHNIAICNVALKQYDEAMTFFNQAIEKDKDYYLSYVERGKVFAQKKQYQKAIADFTRAIELKPKVNFNYFNRGVMYLNVKKIDEGCNDLAKSKELGFPNAQPYIDKYCSQQKVTTPKFTN